MTVYGQDWASYQSATPSTSGLDFAFIKATEGTSYVNPKMTAQAEHARKAGLVVGFYHFARSGDMRKQAAYFVSKAASLEGDPLFLDWEDAHVSSADKDAFLAEVKRLRGDTHRVGLYCNQSYWLHRDKSGNAGDALWIADYVTPGKPRIRAKWLFHQYTSTPVDKDLGAFADRDALREWAHKGKAAPAPAKPTYAKFPGADYFHKNPKSALITRMGKRLVAEGCGEYAKGPGAQWTEADRRSYAKWQHKLGFRGTEADGWPGRESWDKLKVPAK